MVILRSSELREKDDAEMEEHLSELRKKLMKIRGGLASGGIPEDVGKVREIKKTIVRILTIKHERKLGLKRESKKQLEPVVEQKEEKPKPRKTKPKKTKPKKSKPKKSKPNVEAKSKKKTKVVKKVKTKKPEEVLAKK